MKFLARFLIFSALIHGAALWGLFVFWQPALTQSASGMILKVSLQQPLLQEMPEAISATSPARLARVPKKQGDVRRNLPTNQAKLAPLAAHAAENVVTTTASIASVTAAPSAADMVERAKAEIRSAASHAGKESMRSGSANFIRTPSPIERATTQTRQGIEHLAEGLTRITLAGGRQYCLKDLPEIVKRDGPVVPMAVPMNCP